MPYKLKCDNLKTHIHIVYGLVCVLKYACHGEQDPLYAQRSSQTLPTNALSILLIAHLYPLYFSEDVFPAISSIDAQVICNSDLQK